MLKQKKIDEILDRMDDLIIGSKVEVPPAPTIIEAIKINEVLHDHDIINAADLTENLNKLKQFTIERVSKYKELKADGKITALELFLFIRSTLSEELIVMVCSALNDMEPLFDGNFEQYEVQIKSVIAKYLTPLVRDNMPRFLNFPFVVNMVVAMASNVIYGKIGRVAKEIRDV